MSMHRDNLMNASIYVEHLYISKQDSNQHYICM